VLGRQVDTAVAANWPGYKILAVENWTIARNDAFIAQAIAQRQTFYLATEISYQSLWNAPRGSLTVFARELSQVLASGYSKVGNTLVPPPLP
jgi:hypothetical protein